MDFTLSEEQQTIADLAEQILSDRMSVERLKELEQGDWFDRETYSELAKAGLTGIALAEDVGGSGLGLVEVGQVLEAQGRNVAPLPLWSGTLGAMAVDQFGTDEQRQRELPGVVTGERLLTIGIQELHDDNYLAPHTLATHTDIGWAITGTKVAVEFAEASAAIVVTASSEIGAGLFLVDMDTAGVHLTAGQSTRLQPVHQVDLDNAAAVPLGEPGGDGVSWLTDRALALLCATQVGVVDKALKMTAEYSSSREQFGRPIATFQAVTQRLADQFIHVEAVRLCTYAAVWELSEDRDASEHLHVAKWYGSHWAHDVAHATQHIHGGVGVDVDYPLHRYTLWNKHIECTLGAGTQQLRQLGALLAAD
jgi:alkylation response protein AidB-like acyl-CoA dehydrogenase